MIKGTGLICIFLLVLNGGCFAQQQDNPWTQKQLLEPAVLAQQLKLPENRRPVVLDVGPAGVIKGAIETEPAEQEEGIQNLKTVLEDVPKNKEVVIYCGCCPFTKCPNIRPAFRVLLKMGFTNARLLNLSQNLKADWIDKGYPLQEE